MITEQDQAAKDRQMVVDFLHHKPHDVKAAAERLARFDNPSDKSVGEDWLRILGRPRGRK